MRTIPGSMLFDGPRLGTVRRQTRRRRWPWQPKTIRDYIESYRADLATLASQQGAVLLAVVQEQSRPRRWPWQPKTIRDLIDEGSADLVSLAAELSAQLASTVQKRSDALVAAAKQQTRRRRWPWQPKTMRDEVDARSAKLAVMAAERSAKLAALARARRDALLKEAQRQARPRRWPWQPKTIRDRLDERRARSEKALAEQLQVASGRLHNIVDQSSHAVHQRVSATGERVHELRETVPHLLGAAGATAGGTIREAAQGVGAAISATAGTAASTVQRPIAAVNRSVDAGRRRIRRGVRLVSTAFWSLVIGMGLGFLLARIPAEDRRRYMRAIVGEFARVSGRQPEQWQHS